ncbi:carboxylate--amine ligase [Filobacillus milosensis]|uniref:Carboxylate--amine ligase n=1 Tax=Filobacillus milosensis TaxID=94137 RepID=A0A4Y8IPI9_9BACI|nr:carboxylate--amine ligase [Filobacillus milosensis]TFB21701.1 carboxylate--amine ligase [Filobacillus milosensis]
MQPQPFIPIIIGTDMNAYNMAISFHEAYNIHPILIGKEPMSFTKFSTIPQTIEYHSDLWEKESFVKVMSEIAEKYHDPKRKLLLVGTNDFYVRLIIENQEELSKWFVFNYMDEELMNNLLVKKNFYELCKEQGLDTPTTYFYDCSNPTTFEEEVQFPVVIKPSDGVEYYKNKFDGQRKIYRVDSYEEIQSVIDKVVASGYKKDLIIQDYIPGDDTYMWDSIFYLSSKGQVQLGTLAQVVLQEHTATAIGNYTACITRYDEELLQKLQNFLKNIGYKGFANFDIKYDERDGKYKVFEVNIRQGRSSYYATQCGHNMASYFVDDVIFDKTKPLTWLDTHFLFTVVPKRVLKVFVKNKEINKEVRRLIRKKKWGNPMFYKGDKSFKRKLYLILRQFNYYRKYKKNQW